MPARTLLAERSARSDCNFSLDFSLCDVFSSNPVTSATVTAVVQKGVGTAPTVGTPTIVGNVVIFRVSGGSADVTSLILVTATNSASPADDIGGTIVVVTGI
jgi:hypothetical protein